MQLAPFREWRRTRGCGNKRKSDSSTSAWNCSESPASNCTVPSHFIKASEETWRRQTLLFSSHEEEWQSASSTFLPCCLCFKSGEREMDAENTPCATKKRCIPKQNLKLKRLLTLTIICRRLIKWLIYPKKQWKSVAIWHVKISDLNWKILRPKFKISLKLEFRVKD